MTPVDDLIAKVLGIAPAAVRDELEYRSIPEWDSLRHLDLMLAIESQLNTEITADMMVELTSVAAIRRFVADRSKGAKA
jgi:citrate synthase